MIKFVFTFPLLATMFLSCSLGQSANKEEDKEQNDSVQQQNIPVSVEGENTPVQDLSEYFSEDTKNGYTQIQSKSIPHTGGGVYCYFRVKNKKASNMRLHIQYWDDAYADVDHYKFNVDGKTYSYTANRNKETSGGATAVQGSTFYWYDNSINKTDQAFLEALSKSKQASLSLIDRGTNAEIATIVVSEQVKADIQRTFDYYFSLDGSLIPRAGMVNIRD